MTTSVSPCTEHADNSSTRKRICKYITRELNVRDYSSLLSSSSAQGTGFLKGLFFFWHLQPIALAVSGMLSEPDS